MSRVRFLFKDLAWGAERTLEWFRKLVVLPLGKLPTSSPDVFEKVEVEKDVPIPMRDGVRLYGNVYRPRAEGPFPVVLIRMPYGKDEFYCFMPWIGKFWAGKGYACVVQDVRGRFASEGEWDPFVNEIDDGYDTLEWISRQPWCDGNIGATGESYYGYTTWAAALSGHPNLKAIAPSTTSMDIYGTWIYRNGAFCMQTLGVWALQMNARRYRNPLRIDPWHLPLISWDDNAGNPCAYYKDWIRHPARDEYWQPINLNHRYDEIDIPVLHMGGWYDTFLGSTLRDYAGVRENAGSETARHNHWLLMSPIDHEGSPESSGRIGRIQIGTSDGWERWEMSRRFFDYWLRGVDNGLADAPRVKLFVIGDNEWRYENEWPLARTQYTRYYFHSDGGANTSDGDGRLSVDPPEEEPVDTFVYDPQDPLTITLQEDMWYLAQELKDRKAIEGRPDVLVYTTLPLEQDVEITGPISATLYAASSARDTDFTATLVDVFPDGYAHMIQEGVIRASYRDSDADPSLLEPGRVYEYTVDLWATSYVVKRGHRMRVEISSSNFNQYDRNLNTGAEYGISAETVKATQTVCHDAERPSHITLPVIPR